MPARERASSSHTCPLQLARSNGAPGGHTGRSPITAATPVQPLALLRPARSRVLFRSIGRALQPVKVRGARLPAPSRRAAAGGPPGAGSARQAQLQSVARIEQELEAPCGHQGAPAASEPACASMRLVRRPPACNQAQGAARATAGHGPHPGRPRGRGRGPASQPAPSRAHAAGARSPPAAAPRRPSPPRAPPRPADGTRHQDSA